jgi:uncharacterized integral membrane protein
VKRLTWILTLPLIVAAVVFSIANREAIILDLWPFDLSSPPMPLSLALLASLMLGIIIGGLATWLSAGRMRRRARQARRRIEELEREVARLARERAEPSGAAGLPTPAQGPGPRSERGERSAVGS